MPIHDIRARQNVAVPEYPGVVLDVIFIRMEPWSSEQELEHVRRLRDALNIYFADRHDDTRVVIRTVVHPDPDPSEMPEAPASP